METQMTVAKAAGILQCHTETIRWWDRRGILKSRRNHLGHRIFELSDLLRFKHKRERLMEGKHGD